MSKKICEGCDAYAPLNVNNGRGYCRAKPPVGAFFGMEQVNVLGKRAMRPITGTIWAEVGKDEWCREWSPAEVKQAFDPSKLQASGDVGQVNGGSSNSEVKN